MKTRDTQLQKSLAFYHFTWSSFVLRRKKRDHSPNQPPTLNHWIWSLHRKSWLLWFHPLPRLPMAPGWSIQRSWCMVHVIKRKLWGLKNPNFTNTSHPEDVSWSITPEFCIEKYPHKPYDHRVSCFITDVLLKTLCKFHLECDEIQSFLPHQQPLHLSSALGTSNNNTQIQSKISSSILKISSPSWKKRSPKKHGLKKHHQNIPNSPPWLHPIKCTNTPGHINGIGSIRSRLCQVWALWCLGKKQKKWGKGNKRRPNFLAGRLKIPCIYIWREREREISDIYIYIST